MKEDSGRGFRRVVPSPKPIDIVEKEAVESLVGKAVIICGGGGGIPVIKTESGLEGVAAVIDKDFTSAKIAEVLNADSLIILTAVDKVAINFGKENEKWLDELSIAEVQEYIDANEFGAGSMLPKVEAAVGFVKSKEGREALITSLEKAKAALKGETGTKIINK